MEFYETSAPSSWLAAFRDSNTFDLITIILGVLLVISYLVYRKKSETASKQLPYKLTVLGMTFVYISWLLIGLTY